MHTKLPPADDLPLLIRLSAVSVRAGASTLIEDIDLDLAQGPPTLLMGPNGSGKTTLLRLMMQLCQPDEGRLEILPHAGGPPPRRAFVFQKPVMLRRSVEANVAFALGSTGRSADTGVVMRLLDQVGLRALANRPARHLSGGEQQRLALARALARTPDILFLDEPTASLDPAQTKAVEDIVAAIAASGVKVVMATHDPGQARRLGGEVVFLVGGRLVEQTPAHDFFKQPATVLARRFLAGELII